MSNVTNLFLEELSHNLAVWDLETTWYDVRDICEIGITLLDKDNFKKLESWSTLVHTPKIEQILQNNIDKDEVLKAPKFQEVADEIFRLLNNKIWVGHNLAEFDMPILCEHYNRIGKKPPTCKGVIDTLVLFRSVVPKGLLENYKLATYNKYFGLSEQVHRAQQDVDDLIEVMKNVALKMLLTSKVNTPINVVQKSNLSHLFNNMNIDSSTTTSSTPPPSQENSPIPTVLNRSNTVLLASTSTSSADANGQQQKYPRVVDLTAYRESSEVKVLLNNGDTDSKTEIIDRVIANDSKIRFTYQPLDKKTKSSVQEGRVLGWEQVGRKFKFHMTVKNRTMCPNTGSRLLENIVGKIEIL
jgi:DNA polymerase III epsilon subunit-like protein